VLLGMVADQPNRPGLELLVVLLRHDANNLPSKEGVHRTRGGSLRRFYRLTEGEAEVALRLTRGAGLKQIADELSVSYETVRTHLQHAFDKTDTHRQAELVGLVLALTP
ncbi:helix-turn-helix transcriptional regulator, partial [Mycobacterium avium subsp. hominissuis]|uniref:helix-turn-helix transcriptional regulator n=1 Tax=Mycobacterium avium TaxID=1764 RepID=UPI00266554F7